MFIFFLIILEVNLYPVFLRNVNDTVSFNSKIKIFRDDTIEIAKTDIFINVNIINNLNVVTRISIGSW